MSQLYSHAVKTIDQLQISPPPGSVPAPTSLPLTFFDIAWLFCHPIQRVFFYDLHTTNASQFRETILPNLTSSLSLALRNFYPFAARLIFPPRPGKPYFLYSDGDSVPLTVAETTSLDFEQLTSDRAPNDVALLHPLLPKLPPAESKPDGTTVSPLLAVKITLFPNSGVCFGFEFRHEAGDGSAFHHFVKSWASICKFGSAILEPCHDRSRINVPRNLDSILLEQQVRNFVAAWDGDSVWDQFSGKVRATFVVDREDISTLKALVNFPASAFVVASALVWTNLMKSLDLESDDGKIDTYIFMADFRGRLEPQLPPTYFGNCVVRVPVSVARSELLGDDGIVVAAKTIAARIEEIRVEDAENWVTGIGDVDKMGKVVPVAGSPRLWVYETDFGWGRPRKSEPVHIDFSGSVYLSDARDEERGGLEFGLVLSKVEMDTFVALFEQRLKQLRTMD